ncbi:hypothetical protein ACHAXR_005816 [Thalassiosira sp. AJA248-18]
MGSEVEMRSSQPSSQGIMKQSMSNEEEEGTSLLHRGSSSPHSNNHMTSSALDRLAGGGGGGPSLSKDFIICNSAWSRLSFTARSILLLVVGVLLVFATYGFGLDEGVREQERDNSKNYDAEFSWKSWRVFGGGGGGVEKNDDTTDAFSTNANTNAVNHKGPGDKLPTEAIHQTFTRETLAATRSRAMQLVFTLREYYGGPKEGKVIIDPDNMSQEELEHHHHRKRQRTTKLISTMARAILNPHQNKFTIGTIGSSVAAGHDNCHYDAYESQLERTIAPIFAAAGMAAQVQNAGEGGGCGDSHQNQVFCITPNVSPDVDIIHYSWTYFEKVTPELQREQLIRWAQHMERRPMVHHLIARGKKNTCAGDVQENVDLDRTYAMYGYNAFCIQTGLYFGGHDYDAEQENGINRFGWQQHGDGYHNTTRYGEELPDDDPRKASLGTVYRNWHPGPLGFQIASDAFAYVYIRGLMMALDIIEGDMDAGVDLLDRWFDTDDDGGDRRLGSEEDMEENVNDGHSKQSLLRTVTSSKTTTMQQQRQLHHLPPLGDMPDPLFCDPRYCSAPHPPSCLNYEKPTFGTPGITIQSQSNWTIWTEPNKWNKMVGKVDIAIIKAKHDPEFEQKCAHLDACGGIWAQDSTAGTLTFELPSNKMTAGLVFVCGCCGKNIGENMFLQNQNVTFKLNGRVLNKSKMDVYPAPKCVRLFKYFGESSGYEKEDKMLLSIEMADQDPSLSYEAKPPSVKISHVVAL